RLLFVHGDIDIAVDDLCRIGPEIDADRRAFRLPRLVVEATIVLGTFDDVAHDKPVGKMNALVRTQAVGRKIVVVGAAVDGIGAAGRVESDDILLVDIVGRADPDPALRHVLSPLRSHSAAATPLGSIPSSSFRARPGTLRTTK